MKFNCWRIAFFISYLFCVSITIWCSVALGIQSHHHKWFLHDCNITQIEFEKNSNFYDYIVSLELVSVEFNSDPFQIKIPSIMNRNCQRISKRRHILKNIQFPICPVQGEKIPCYLHFKDDQVDQIQIQNPEDITLYIVGLCVFGPFAVFLFFPFALHIHFCLESSSIQPDSTETLPSVSMIEIKPRFHDEENTLSSSFTEFGS